MKMNGFAPHSGGGKTYHAHVRQGMERLAERTFPGTKGPTDGRTQICITHTMHFSCFGKRKDKKCVLTSYLLYIPGSCFFQSRKCQKNRPTGPYSSTYLLFTNESTPSRSPNLNKKCPKISIENQNHPSFLTAPHTPFLVVQTSTNSAGGFLSNKVPATNGRSQTTCHAPRLPARLSSTLAWGNTTNAPPTPRTRVHQA